MILEVCNISKNYGSLPAVKEASFSMREGEIVGFLGLNGAGKSTVMKIIAGCIPFNAGSVQINGIELKKNDLEYKSHLGFLPENNPLYDEMYVLEYLEYVAGLYAMDSIREEARKVVRQTGLQTEVSKKIGQLSKGYRQRLGLAQAIIHHPDLLILDEPTSGLDPRQTEEMLFLLHSLSKEKGILFSSHTLSEVSILITRVLIIHHGEIIADLPRDETGDLEVLFKDLTKI
ncbi:MAG: ABC transporter ATP-binding protein [Candidatus Azobacteroides sp.]|nr:ABC transporter ATP-binding protein [Candidatus Azobacteroides sp.]